MILGLLSDTHGNLPRTRAALERLRAFGAEVLVHCGDLGSEAVMDLLFEAREGGTPVYAVPGNVDEWDSEMALYARNLGLPFPREQRFEVDGLRCALFHGHDPVRMEELMAAADVDVLFTGHTHVPRDEVVGRVRVINPGAVHRANPPGVSVFDTGSGDLTFLTI